MSKKDLRELNDYFKETYPYLLELYKFLYKRKVNDINERFNYLILLISILLIVSFETLILTSYSKLFYIPIFLLFLSLSPIFFTLYPKKIWFHWFEKKDYMDFFFKKKNFFEMGFRDIFGTIPYLTAYNKFNQDLYLISTNLLLLSMGSSMIIAIFSISNSYMITLIVSLILIESIVLIDIFRRRELIKNPSNEAGDFFNKFIEKNKKENG
tara:strand:- start:2272 stop:2904 length:633 start_codon:yes stop_codon:yes gene_type:complete